MKLKKINLSSKAELNILFKLSLKSEQIFGYNLIKLYTINCI